MRGPVISVILSLTSSLLFREFIDPLSLYVCLCLDY